MIADTVSRMKKLSMPVTILVFGAAGVLGLWLVCAFVRLGHPVEKWGVFGDKFGSLNCLFTGLAMIGVVAALWHEREQAREREAETKAMAARLEEQTQAVREQAAAIAEASRIEALGRKIDRYQARLQYLSSAQGPVFLRQGEMARLRSQIRDMEQDLDRAIGLSGGSNAPT